MKFLARTLLAVVENHATVISLHSCSDIDPVGRREFVDIYLSRQRDLAVVREFPQRRRCPGSRPLNGSKPGFGGE